MLAPWLVWQVFGLASFGFISVTLGAMVIAPAKQRWLTREAEERPARWPLDKEQTKPDFHR